LRDEAGLLDEGGSLHARGDEGQLPRARREQERDDGRRQARSQVGAPERQLAREEVETRHTRPGIHGARPAGHLEPVQPRGNVDAARRLHLEGVQ